MADTMAHRDLNPKCEDYNSDDSDDGVVLDDTFGTSPVPTANVAAKRSPSAELGNLGKLDVLPSDMQSDSGYSSHTVATMGGADSGPSARSPPTAPTSAAPIPPPSPATGPTRRRQTLVPDEKQQSNHSSPRKPLQRAPSTTSKRPPTNRRPSTTVTTETVDCTDPNCRECGPNALAYRNRRLYYAHGPAVVQPAQTRRRSSLTTGPRRPATYYSEDPGQAYYGQGALSGGYPGTPQEHGPPPTPYLMPTAAPYYQNGQPMGQHQRPPLSARNSSNPNYQTRRPVSGYGPAQIIQQDQSEKMPSARYPSVPKGTRHEELQDEEDSESSDSEYSSGEEERPRHVKPRELMPPPKLKTSSKDRRPPLQKAITTTVINDGRNGSRGSVSQPQPDRWRDSTVRTQAPSISHPPLVQNPKAVSFPRQGKASIVVENTKTQRRRSYQQPYETDYDRELRLRRSSKVYYDHYEDQEVERKGNSRTPKVYHDDTSTLSPVGPRDSDTVRPLLAEVTPNEPCKALKTPRDKSTDIPHPSDLNASHVSREIGTEEDVETDPTSYKGAIGPTNAKFDSGYGSILDAVSKSNEQDDDGRSVRSILTNASRVLLPPQEEGHLISEFAGDLCQDIGFRGDLGACDRISARLPDLLKTFTLRLEECANSKTERDAKEFIRQQRDRITYQFREIRMPAEISEDTDLSTPPEDGMSPVEKVKMAGWPTAEHFDCLHELAPVDQQLAPVDQQLDEVQAPPRYQEVRSFLLDGSAYQWLLENARSSALLTERKGTILDAVTREIDATFSSMSPKSRRSQVFQANFDMDWDLPNFLRDQEYDTTFKIAIERAITVTGSSSNAQALSCMDYMCQIWPSSGRGVVRVLQKALISPNLSCSGCLVDGTKLNINLRLSRASIVACGSQASLTDLSEQLAWLGASLRTSPVSFGICLSTPVITISKDARSSSPVPSITVHLGFTVTPSLGHGLSTDTDGTCWHAMFRNPVVVSGFPILARRKNEQGLELPFDIMSILAETHFATRYDTTLVLKGLCTMLVPTRQTERSITWHFLFNEDGKRIPYYSFRERCPGWISTHKVSTDLLEAGKVRNFVGWASDITRHLGTEEVEYDKINWAGAKECSAGLAVEQKLTISVSKIVGGSGSVVRGNRDKPEYVKQSAYSMQIKNARNIYVVLYDVAAQRGWLTDGASALLHLVRTQVVREPYGGASSLFNNPSFNRSTFNHPGIDGGPNAAADILKENGNMKHVILREFDSYTDETAVPRLESVSTVGEGSSNEANNPSGNETPNLGEGRKEKYKITSLRELVSQTWSTLEQIFDRQIEVATTHTSKQLQISSFRSTLEGYEFMDIVSAEHILTQRNVDLQSNGQAWIELTMRIHAITLFGQHFGDIYKPVENIGSRLCKNWKTVPRGQEYLAAPISLLKEIKQHSWKRGKVDTGSPEIAEGLLWSPLDAFNACGLNCKHSYNRVQQLRSSKPRKIGDKIGLGKNVPRKADAFAEINGAVLFGKSSTLDVKKLELGSPLAVQTEGSFHDSGVGTSLQASSQANSAIASSSGVNPDSQPALPSADSTRTSPSPLDQTVSKSTSGDRATAGDTTCGTENPSPTSCASAEAGCVGAGQTDDVGARNSSLPQQAMSPGPAVTNMSTEDVPALDPTLGRRKFTASMWEKFAKITPSRWKRGDAR